MLLGKKTFFIPLFLLAGVFFLWSSAFSFSFFDVARAELSNDKSPQRSFPPKAIESFLGETATYDISFLWFDKAAVATFKVEREGKGLKATLVGETKGFVGFLTSYRKHVYISHMDYLPEQKKLRTSLFERYVVIGKHTEKSKTFLNYDIRRMTWETTKNKKIDLKGCAAIPEEIEYEDILSAFLNFRSGAYGAIEQGRKFNIHTIPSEGQSIIEVNITREEEAKRDRLLFGTGYDDKLIYIKVRVPKEIFKSATGEVSMWIDEKIIPIRGVVKDYIGFGDMTGILQEEK